MGFRGNGNLILKSQNSVWWVNSHIVSAALFKCALKTFLINCYKARSTWLKIMQIAMGFSSD